MFSAILILLLLSITDVSRSRGMQFRPLSKWAFFVFVANFLILMQLGAKHVESPFIEFGQISTVLYFLYFTVAMYGVTFVENTVVDINMIKDEYFSVLRNLKDKYAEVLNNFKSYESSGLLLQSVFEPLIDALELIVNNIPSGSQVYDMVKDATDVPKALDSWSQSANQAIDSAHEAVKAADSAGATQEEVETAKSSAEALAESGKAEVEESRQVAEDYYENDKSE